MKSTTSENDLFSRLHELNRNERDRLSPLAVTSEQAIRRKQEIRPGYRQQFALDADRILHSRAYTRYIDKTQVFCLVENDHITHRVLHVQLVSRIARTIGRFLHLNEDLIEAIALGHDIGHPPFGHDGETFLSEICLEHGLPSFQHNLQSVRFLDKLERKGRGWNLTVQTLDGILCHDGEVHSRSLNPESDLSFSVFDAKMRQKQTDPTAKIVPSTLEGCVVRLADTIAYIGRDIEDAIVLGLIKRDDIPKNCKKLFGDTNGTIVYTLVTDLLTNSRVTDPGGQSTAACTIGFSQEASETLRDLKQFNYERIYFAPETKKNYDLIRACYRNMFRYYIEHLSAQGDDCSLQVDLMRDVGHEYNGALSAAEMVRDFIAGMTDDFFISQAAQIGCRIPEKQ
ncbi:deoxyguanosinetriphosphate triphosphohydrolase family protein [Desulfopila sp. IMCC35008]|uniref:deoxyguanosinetriphosphate triphosphohydrolase family protein n=1 Tax=Desulfopila sp. IMCC35008 TaxID=2653858 RepID=UPI0013D4C7B6|nr:HD domain-containing protein [Desulfopila sp. IMCC35008]